MMRCLALFLLSIRIGFANPPPDSASEADRKEYRDGSAAASADLSKAFVKYEIVGLPGPHAEDLAREAKQRYGIAVLFHGCIPGPRVWYDQATWTP